MYALKISATCSAFVLLLLIPMSIASSSDFDRRAQAWTQARAELVLLGVPSDAWPRRTTPLLMYTYWLHNPLDRLPRIAVLLTVQRFEIPSQDLGTEHSVCFPFGDDAHAAWEACKRRAGWQPSLHQQQSHVAAALQGPLLRNPHSRNTDAPPSDTITLTPAAVAEAAAASGARLTKAAAASGARQPAAQDEEMLMMRDWTSMKHNDPEWRWLMIWTSIGKSRIKMNSLNWHLLKRLQQRRCRVAVPLQKKTLLHRRRCGPRHLRLRAAGGAA